ncbi:MAG: hypothetical protein OHK0039_35830 [Bacteroidia bacterium]
MLRISTLQITLFLTIVLLPVAAQAQYEQVQFDYSYAYFNNGQPLPAESRLIVSGDISPDISLVELELFRGKDKQKTAPLHTAVWKRQAGESGTTFRIPFNYLLRGNEEYDFRFIFFRPLSQAETQALRAKLYQALDSYLDQAVVVRGSSLDIAKGRAGMIADLDALVGTGLTYYRSMNYVGFDGFSDVVRTALGNLAGAQPPQGSNPTAWRAALLAPVGNLLHNELDQVLNAPMVIQQDVREVEAYRTAATRRTLALNVGYGGVFFDADPQSLSYDSAPYIGLSFPLANPRIGGRLLGNASLSAGVFFNNFTDADGETVTGPIFGRPYYLGLGYNFFRFVRLNVGATALETPGNSSAGGGSAAFDAASVVIRPFVGLSAEIDLWIGLRERR